LVIFFILGPIHPPTKVEVIIIIFLLIEGVGSNDRADDFFLLLLHLRLPLPLIHFVASLLFGAPFRAYGFYFFLGRLQPLLSSIRGLILPLIIEGLKLLRERTRNLFLEQLSTRKKLFLGVGAKALSGQALPEIS